MTSNGAPLTIASEFVATDFARIGDGWGAIEDALEETRPAVLDIVTEATPIFEIASL